MKHKCDGCKHAGKIFRVCLMYDNDNEAEEAYKAEKCPFKKTHFDRIKAMSVEEMAEFINKNYKCKKCAYYHNFAENPDSCNGECQNGIAEWLEREVQEE